MTYHPYKILPSQNFWSKSVSNIDYSSVDPVVESKFRITRSDKVVTAGSCFAQHIARRLSDNGFCYFVTEKAPAFIPRPLATKYGYGVFSARYANVYTSRQLVQLLHRAYGSFVPAEDVWVRDDGRLIDPFRPQIQPDGFASKADYLACRKTHFAAVRQAVENLDVFVFTLGLTETWASKHDGAVYPLCPGVWGGSFDHDTHEFVNLRVSDLIGDLEEAVSFIRERNPNARFIFTVSPVPLVATAERRSVLVSTTYSKSVLRVAAEELAATDDRIAYFPSYEIITGSYTRGRYFADDLREVTTEGVDHVMRLFLAHYGDTEGADPTIPERSTWRSRSSGPAASEIEAALQIVCEEVALGR